MWVEPRWAKQETGGAAGPRSPNPPRGVALHQFESRALVNALSAQGDLQEENLLCQAAVKGSRVTQAGKQAAPRARVRRKRRPCRRASARPAALLSGWRWAWGGGPARRPARPRARTRPPPGNPPGLLQTAAGRCRRGCGGHQGLGGPCAHMRTPSPASLNLAGKAAAYLKLQHRRSLGAIRNFIDSESSFRLTFSTPSSPNTNPRRFYPNSAGPFSENLISNPKPPFTNSNET